MGNVDQFLDLLLHSETNFGFDWRTREWSLFGAAGKFSLEEVFDELFLDELQFVGQVLFEFVDVCVSRLLFEREIELLQLGPNLRVEEASTIESENGLKQTLIENVFFFEGNASLLLQLHNEVLQGEGDLGNNALVKRGKRGIFLALLLGIKEVVFRNEGVLIGFLMLHVCRLILGEQGGLGESGLQRRDEVGHVHRSLDGKGELNCSLQFFSSFLLFKFRVEGLDSFLIQK